MRFKEDSRIVLGLGDIVESRHAFDSGAEPDTFAQVSQ